MRRYLVIGHRTLGGAHLIEHLRQLRSQDSSCEFHVLVPEYAAPGWADFEIRAEAEARLDDMVQRLAAMGLDATGEVGTSDPVLATRKVIDRDGEDTFAGIVLSTLPRQFSQWWTVADDLDDALPSIPLTHLVADRAFAR